jgi:hypothetical protein
MAIITSNDRPKRASRKIRPRTYPADMPLIVTAPMKKRRGPVIRLSEQQQTSDNGQQQQRRSAIVEPKQRNKLDDYDPEKRRREGPRDRAPGLHCQRVTEAPLASARRSRATAARHDPSRAAPGAVVVVLWGLFLWLI